ncbi:hypothetical protein [Vreelandella populi]|uniref:hypothetical protein n=1 Tax=Vreelandella populi TaxID=2498858 RepID=UPI000F8D47FA|nr:hypothetical protein [Halomonas populi]RUR52014.1 hypothetical protein ELY40_14980 [Halomonas populi]
MNKNTDATNAGSIRPRLNSLEVYLWAIQGPFKNGNQSALTMAKIVFVESGEEKLKDLEREMILHQKNYDQNQGQWERWRKEFIRDNLPLIGSKEGGHLKESERKMETVSEYNPYIKKIIELLSDYKNRAYGTLSDVDMDGMETQSNYINSDNQSQWNYTLINLGNSRAKEAVSIFNKMKLKFMRLISGMTILILIAIFLSVWGVLISRNFILGLSLGWIPAFIISYMASIFVPLLMLLSALLIFTAVGLLAWLGYIYIV